MREMTPIQRLSPNALALLREFGGSPGPAADYALAKARYDRRNASAYEAAYRELVALGTQKVVL